MQTKEEILFKHSSNSMTKYPNSIRTEVLAAMEAYASQFSPSGLSAEDALKGNAFMHGGNTDIEKWFYSLGFKDGYKASAPLGEEDAKRIEELEDGLRSIEQMSDPGSPETAIVRMKDIATQLLNNKNNKV